MCMCYFVCTDGKCMYYFVCTDVFEKYFLYNFVNIAF